MDRLVEALAPVLVASIALQQLLELLDPILDSVISEHKKWILSAVSLVVGLVLAFGLGLRVLAPFGVTRAPWLDAIVTALFITGGTKVFNELIKWIGYMKEVAKQRLDPSRIKQV